MLPNHVEASKNMNSTIGKFAKWDVRIIEPKIIQHEFKPRGGTETESAERFECVLVSKDPAEYMLATAEGKP